MSDAREYSVGWVCAISTEYVAAKAFLDQVNEGPRTRAPNDNNVYTFGTIHRHNVVIAVLPDGEYGIATAAGVARDMVRSFLNLRFCLMVGVGGGAPCEKHDIRLGDIVVSASRAGEAAVFQYDYGKTIQDQKFRETGYLSLPPPILRAAVSGLRAQYELDGHRIDESINTILLRKPRIKKKYSRPSTDKLYNSSVVHPKEPDSQCEIACGTDPPNLVQRDPRTDDDDNPAIHYGLIASANQLMKDALVRDKLAQIRGVLCFEMEAAGLMNQFPCLVIRGICDYSDSHKNKDWQGFAAMAAAAYAKDLLQQILPEQIEAETKISDTLNGLRTDITELRACEREKNDQIILHWLSPINYGNQQSDILDRRQLGTGYWFLEQTEFKEWIQSPGKVLYCPGVPGAGKTMLTSIVVDHVTNKFHDHQTHGIAYLYCNFQRQDEQRLGHLLLNLLKQFAQALVTLPECVLKLFHQHDKKCTRPTLDDIKAALYSVLARHTRAFIIIDALDECSTIDGRRMKFITEILDIVTRFGTNIMVTSRINNEIAQRFKDHESYSSIPICASNEDVECYVKEQLKLLPSDVLDDDIKIAIIQKIPKSIGGMFLLARLHMDALKVQPTIGDMRVALQGLALSTTGLDEMYAQIVQRIENQEHVVQQLAKRTLAWIVNARIRLSPAELTVALAVRPGMTEIDGDWVPSLDRLLSICEGFVVIDKTSDSVQLVHLTAHEYLDRTQMAWFPTANLDIAKTCVRYLSTVPSHEEQDRIPLGLFSWYCYNHWTYHCGDEMAINHHDLLDHIISFWACKNSQFWRIRRHWLDLSKVPKDFLLQHALASVGARAGLLTAIHDKEGFDIDARDSDGRTALMYASEKGHHAVEWFIRMRANVNTKDQNGQTALMLAVSHRNKKVVQLLLDANADVNAKTHDGRSSLSISLQRNDEELVRLLLNFGALLYPNEGCFHYIQWSKVRKTTVELLLDAGVAIRASEDGVIFFAFLDIRDEEFVRYLFASGTTVRAANDSNGTIYQLHDTNIRIMGVLLDFSPVREKCKFEGQTKGHTVLCNNATYYEELIRILVRLGKLFTVNSTSLEKVFDIFKSFISNDSLSYDLKLAIRVHILEAACRFGDGDAAEYLLSQTYTTLQDVFAFLETSQSHNKDLKCEHFKTFIRFRVGDTTWRYMRQSDLRGCVT